MDEATNQLDNENELTIIEYLKSTKVTTILSEHRQTVIDTAGAIFEMPTKNLTERGANNAE